MRRILTLAATAGLLLSSPWAHAELLWSPHPTGGHAHHAAAGQGHGGHGRASAALYLQDAAGATAALWPPTVQPRPLALAADGKAALRPDGINNYRALAAVRRDSTLVESALRYQFSAGGKPSGHSPAELTAAQKLPLEIVPDPLPREHWRYTGGRQAVFRLRFDGAPLADSWVGLETSNGSRLQARSDAAGRVAFTLPDDFSQVQPGRNNNRPAEFTVRSGAVADGVLYRTNLSAAYYVNPSHWQSGGQALLVTGLGFLAGLGLVRLGGGRKEKRA